PPGTQLTWPVTLNGGVGPYALSVDWGDGTSADLMSVTTPGNVTLKHVYKAAGVYTVIVKATDKNGAAAFLQLVGQATGAIQNNKNGTTTIIQTQTSWWQFAVMIPLLLLSFWLGGQHKVRRLHREFEE